jgi:hypothetical protein
MKQLPYFMRAVLVRSMVIGACAACACVCASAPAWRFVESGISGTQCDAAVGPGPFIHVMANYYHRLRADGSIDTVDTRIRDGGQIAMVFPPAIAVDGSGAVHVVGRQGGSYDDNRIWYFHLALDGALAQREFGERVQRNYVVGVAAAGPTQVFMMHSECDNSVWGDLHLFGGGSAAVSLGTLSGVWRSDSDARIRGHNGVLYFASGLPDPSGKVFFSWANASANVYTQLVANKQTHTGGGAGGTRRGFPDMYIDGAGSVHLTYGCQIGQVLYNRYSSSHTKAYATDKLILQNLGEHHTTVGLSAVASSTDGRTIVVVGIQQHELNGELVYVQSVDGGATWSGKTPLGRYTDTGEGRRRPRMVAIGNTFYLFYYDLTANCLMLGTLSFDSPSAARSGPRANSTTPALVEGAGPAGGRVVDMAGRLYKNNANRGAGTALVRQPSGVLIRAK